MSGDMDVADLTEAATDIKCMASRGSTLVKVYGSYSTVAKFFTLFARGYIYKKYDKIARRLRDVLPAPDRAGLGRSSLGLPSPTGAGPAAGRDPVTDTTKPLQRASLSNPAMLPGSAGALGAPIQGTMLRDHHRAGSGYLKVHAIAFVPDEGSEEGVRVWWSAGSALEIYSERSQASTSFEVDKALTPVTALNVDKHGTTWMGHQKGLVRVRKEEEWEFAMQVRGAVGRVGAHRNYSACGRARGPGASMRACLQRRAAHSGTQHALCAGRASQPGE